MRLLFYKCVWFSSLSSLPLYIQEVKGGNLTMTTKKGKEEEKFIK
jgi:hypothetical protein